ncbi:hypothetical protein D6T64_14130 [Cryobacterium melibiosiphilum]|uniref:Uncharacterized protein n=1 Tax=Cryobacterium melibiosiphilum TaxID=995039 RepID=A0A3A5MKS5_9MICO|nr:hypothetical protein [Cryobacterium melibiosiphilum]RJT87453.1 hypothetical protein D6T64_14130 [Cryobacterium melibiosiphilum]
MRWDNLFDDLEGQLEYERDAEDSNLRAEEERLRLGRLALRGRLVSIVADDAVGVVRLVLVSGDRLTLRPDAFGRDWLAADLLAGAAPGAQCVVPLGAIAGVLLQPGQVEGSLALEAESSARLSDRIGLPFVLRDLCRRRTSVEVQTPTERLYGTIDRVGRDHLDLAVHEPGSVRRAAEVHEVRIVPLAHIVLVRLGRQV